MSRTSLDCRCASPIRKYLKLWNAWQCGRCFRRLPPPEEES